MSDAAGIEMRLTAIRRAVSPSVCKAVALSMLQSPSRPGTVLRKGVDTVDSELRVCQQVVLPPSEATALIEQAFLAAGLRCSHGKGSEWLLDGPLYNRYPVSGMFRSHTDTSTDPSDPPCVRNRRLTLVCFLNDDSADPDVPRCEGGALVVYVRGHGGLEARLFRPEGGTVVAFDAALMHEVRPVIRGERLTAVGWLYSREELQHGQA